MRSHCNLTHWKLLLISTHMLIVKTIQHNLIFLKRYTERNLQYYCLQIDSLSKLYFVVVFVVQISKLDSKNAKWQLDIFNVRRTQRRLTQGEEIDVPTSEERLAIGKATELDPDNIQIIIACCVAMMDWIKYHGINWKGGACFGKGRYVTNGDEVYAAAAFEAWYNNNLFI